ncbi:MAG: PIN domain-containing protein [Euryarchaeota archaeon]|nr:PIN domain-containing protein [Euryarchaeota archaeon]
MNLIVDANVIIAAMVRDSAVRRLMLTLPFKFYCPDFAFEEINKHLSLISRKNSLSIEENKRFLKTLSKYMKTVEYELYRRKLPEAEEIIGGIDEGDVPYIALALSLNNDGIWTEDRHFSRQNKIKIWSTEDLLNRFGRLLFLPR